MPTIAWLDDGRNGGGSWGPPETLVLPCNARGLLLGEGLFETVLVLNGLGALLSAHVERWQRSAAHLGLAPPPGVARVQELLAAAIDRSGISRGALRLNWCRSSGARGLQPPDPRQESSDDYLFWLQLSAMEPDFAPARVIISPTEVRQASSLLSRCKTFGYGSALIARRQAMAAGADDALLRSSDGTLCCGTSANLLVMIDDRWQTPRLTSGCLPGVMRGRALERGLAWEGDIKDSDLETGHAAVLINSLSCRPIRPLGQNWSEGSEAVDHRRGAEQLWRSLLLD